MKIRQGLTFDDVLLIPKHSKIKSRKNVDLSVNLGRGITLDIPVMSSNMKTVTGLEMCVQLLKFGGMPVMHRFYDTAEQQISEFIRAKTMCRDYQLPCNIGVSIGINEGSVQLAERLVDSGAKIICVDVAHGDHSVCLETVNQIRKRIDVLLIAGNVATASGAQNLYDAGADVIKTGIGGGSICTTRVETGNGFPQLTSLEEVYEQSDRGKKFKVVSDGGVRTAGDCVKALCFAHTLMIGNILAGTDEAPGDTITVDGKKYKTYAGSSTHKSNHVEGVVGLVPYKGPVHSVISGLLEGIRSGCSYQGANNLEELKKDPEFVSVSHAGLVESRSHDVLVIK